MFLQYRTSPEELYRTALCINYKINHFNSCRWWTTKGEWIALFQRKERQAAWEPCPPVFPIFSGERRESVMLGRPHGHSHPLPSFLFLSFSPVFSFSCCCRAFQMKKLFPWHQTLNLKHINSLGLWSQCTISYLFYSFLVLLWTETGNPYETQHKNYWL